MKCRPETLRAMLLAVGLGAFGWDRAVDALSRETSVAHAGDEKASPAEHGSASKGVDAKPATKAKPKKGEPEILPVPGHGRAYVFSPAGSGLKPVLMYLHGRGGYPAEDCKKWAKVAREFGWAVCPEGQEDRGNGARGWNNDPSTGRVVVNAALAALREKYARRVQLRGNVIVGFSEGAFVAMQAGLNDAKTWNRWLILGASDAYIPPNKEAIEEKREDIKRVFLFTGQTDEVAPATERAAKLLRSASVSVKTKLEPGLGHEVPAEKMKTNYRRPLLWLLKD